ARLKGGARSGQHRFLRAWRVRAATSARGAKRRGDPTQPFVASNGSMPIAFHTSQVAGLPSPSLPTEFTQVEFATLFMELRGGPKLGRHLVTKAGRGGGTLNALVRRFLSAPTSRPSSPSR